MTNTSVYLRNDYFSETGTDYFQATLTRCTGGGCASDDEIDAYYDNNQLNFAQVGHYYDHDDLDDPIKQYIEIYQPLFLDGSSSQFYTISIDETIVNFIDGSSTTFYDGGIPQVYSSDTSLLYNGSLVMTLQLSGEVYEINQMYDYQPIMDDRRMLEDKSRNLEDITTTTTTTTTTEDVNDGFLYSAFFVMAQIGGFYAFLQLTIGSTVSYFYDKLLMVDILNKFNRLNLKTKANKVKKYLSASPELHEESKGRLMHPDGELAHEGGNHNMSGSYDNGRESIDHDQLISRSNLNRPSITSQDKSQYTLFDAMKLSCKLKKSKICTEDLEKSALLSNSEKFEQDL